MQLERTAVILRGYPADRSSIAKTCGMEALAKLAEDDPALLRDTMVMLRNLVQKRQRCNEVQRQGIAGKAGGGSMFIRGS